jgi:hypothetical protein
MAWWGCWLDESELAETGLDRIVGLVEGEAFLVVCDMNADRASGLSYVKIIVRSVDHALWTPARSTLRTRQV